jgi:hypothetical protein
MISYFMINLALEYSESLLFQLIALVVCGGMPLSYLIVAISNPGIVTQEPPAQMDEENLVGETGWQRKCMICKIVQKPGVRHCSECDVCVKDFDHHCPWTSKCIGGENKMRFYAFLGCVPIYFIYIMAALSILMSSRAIDLPMDDSEGLARRGGMQNLIHYL